ncbi:MAG: isoprenylcysteine carboxylmethyltransferase family protein [Ignavibacteriales bacterium]|nr:isoprenylcysteine carboxylmethyltransferase family protein [Ignavibacteriales bacterium]
MSYFFDVLTLILLFALYGFIHSILASNRVKLFIKKIFGKLIAFYRLLFNVLGVVGLYLIWDLAPHPPLQIYKLPPPYDYLVLIPQLISLIGMFWCFKYVCFKEFIGLNQVDRYLKNVYSDNELDENYTMRIAGPYKYSRHPIYFFSIIFLLFRAEMDLFYLTMFISFTAYFYIGSYYEEKKMVSLFGEEYTDYQKKVPKIFPVKL